MLVQDKMLLQQTVTELQGAYQQTMVQMSDNKEQIADLVSSPQLRILLQLVIESAVRLLLLCRVIS